MISQGNLKPTGAPIPQSFFRSVNADNNELYTIFKMCVDTRIDNKFEHILVPSSLTKRPVFMRREIWFSWI